MKQKTLLQILLFIVIVAVVVIAIVHFNKSGNNTADTSGTAATSSNTTPTGTETASATAHFACNNAASIDAAFYDGPSTPAASPDQPPVPGGSVALKLSDGRSMTLKQTISADGGRYANADESFVFWDKGNTALVLENSVEKNFVGCISVKPDAALSNVYHNFNLGVTLRYPADYTVDESYIYSELGPGKNISGTKFTIPASVAKGTNLADDTYVSVEKLAGTSGDNCTADRFVDLSNGEKATTVTDGGTTYSYITTTGAGAGNRYEEDVYSIPGTNPCMAIRYFIHYAVIDNYPPGTVKEFDEASLKKTFDEVRQSLTINE